MCNNNCENLNVEIEKLNAEIEKLKSELQRLKGISSLGVDPCYDIPVNCRNCSQHPSNGGSGICHCILGMTKVTC